MNYASLAHMEPQGKVLCSRLTCSLQDAPHLFPFQDGDRAKFGTYALKPSLKTAGSYDTVMATV